MIAQRPRLERKISSNILRIPVPGSTPAILYTPNRYRLESEPRGICLIVNIAEFTPLSDSQQVALTDAADTENEDEELHDREGSHHDVKALKELFEWRKFDVRCCTSMNINKDELLCLIKNVQRMDHANYDAFVCCIMSHGELGNIITSDGQRVEILKVAEHFNEQNCPSLCGKPKLFFVQACQITGRPSIPVSTANPSESLMVPTGQGWSDFLISYSTLPGRYSYRNPSRGYVYVQALVDNIKKGAELREVLHSVQQEIKNEVHEICQSAPDTQLPFYHETTDFRPVYLCGKLTDLQSL